MAGSGGIGYVAGHVLPDWPDGPLSGSPVRWLRPYGTDMRLLGERVLAREHALSMYDYGSRGHPGASYVHALRLAALEADIPAGRGRYVVPASSVSDNLPVVAPSFWDFVALAASTDWADRESPGEPVTVYLGESEGESGDESADDSFDEPESFGEDEADSSDEPGYAAPVPEFRCSHPSMAAVSVIPGQYRDPDDSDPDLPESAKYSVARFDARGFTASGRSLAPRSTRDAPVTLAPAVSADVFQFSRYVDGWFRSGAFLLPGGVSVGDGGYPESRTVWTTYSAPELATAPSGSGLFPLAVYRRPTYPWLGSIRYYSKDPGGASVNRCGEAESWLRGLGPATETGSEAESDPESESESDSYECMEPLHEFGYGLVGAPDFLVRYATDGEAVFADDADVLGSAYGVARFAGGAGTHAAQVGGPGFAGLWKPYAVPVGGVGGSAVDRVFARFPGESEYLRRRVYGTTPPWTAAPLRGALARVAGLLRAYRWAAVRLTSNPTPRGAQLPKIVLARTGKTYGRDSEGECEVKDMSEEDASYPRPTDGLLLRGYDGDSVFYTATVVRGVDPGDGTEFEFSLGRLPRCAHVTRVFPIVVLSVSASFSASFRGAGRGSTSTSGTYGGSGSADAEGVLAVRLPPVVPSASGTVAFSVDWADVLSAVVSELGSGSCAFLDAVADRLGEDGYGALRDACAVSAPQMHGSQPSAGGSAPCRYVPYEGSGVNWWDQDGKLTADRYSTNESFSLYVSCPGLSRRTVHPSGESRYSAYTLTMDAVVEFGDEASELGPA